TRPSPAPIELGRFAVVDRRLPEIRTAYDGIETKSVDGRVMIVSVQDGSPAAQAGAGVGDELLEVNGHAVGGMSGRSVNLLLYGEPGAATSIVVRRGLEPPRRLEFQL